MKLAAIAIASIAVLQCVDAFDVVKMLCLVNKERRQHGKAPLGLNQKLNNAAAQHSSLQARVGDIAHQFLGELGLTDRVTNAGYDWLKVAENVAYGYPDEESCMAQLMSSPGHRANILGDFTEFGAAVAYRGSTPYYTQDFAADGKGGSYPECPSSAHSASSPSPSAGTAAATDAPAPATSTHAATESDSRDDAYSPPAPTVSVKSDDEAYPSPFPTTASPADNSGANGQHDSYRSMEDDAPVNVYTAQPDNASDGQQSGQSAKKKNCH